MKINCDLSWMCSEGLVPHRCGAGRMEMKSGGHAPSSTALYFALHIIWLCTHEWQATSKSNGWFVVRENDMDFDLTGIYGVQSEGTVKMAMPADAPLDAGLYF